MTAHPGLVILLGSGETAPSIRKVYDWVFKQLSPSPCISVMETPAGFEPNSDKVAGRIAEFLEHRLQNYHPRVTVVPARKRRTPFSPDNADIVAPMLHSDVLFMGPGSPTYAVRQLQDTLAWHILMARHRLGASLIFASATTLAVSGHALPVYEIYKVGEDLHWHLGLDFFGMYGLSLVFIPHWDNTEGGEELDTRHCYMGQARFEKLFSMLPPNQTVVGIDEHTALVLDLANQQFKVMGKGGVTLLRNNDKKYFTGKQNFDLAELGSFKMPPPETMVPKEVWRMVQQAADKQKQANTPPPEVLNLVEQRENARANKDWPAADDLRDRIAAMGWQINDTPNGPELESIP